MKNIVAFASVVFFLSLLPEVNAQGITEYNSGLRVNIDNDTTKYFRLLTWHQVWLRFNDNNAGSTRQGVPVDQTADIGLRRSRFMIYAQMNDRLLVMTHFGINNQNAFSGGIDGTDGKKPQIFMHDAWVEYAIIKKAFHLGGGLHYWNGVSRMTSASTLNFLTMDAPIFNWPTLERTDQFARMLGLYAKGMLGRLEYRLAVNDPFKVAGMPQVNIADYNKTNVRKAITGYFSYNFLDKEEYVVPFYVGTYLGSKRVFNIGAGFLQNREAMRSINSMGDTLLHRMTHLAFDVFLDMPLGENKRTAITAYGVFYNYEFGPNYVRYGGVMNSADGGGPLRGNAIPLLGTGQILYFQTGFLLPKSKLNTRLQPYLGYSHAWLEGVRNIDNEIVPVQVLDFGLNYYLTGHHAKLSLNYRNRPDFNNIENVVYRPEITLQLMAYL